jgi:translation initiation factor IF-2
MESTARTFMNERGDQPLGTRSPDIAEPGAGRPLVVESRLRPNVIRRRIQRTDNLPGGSGDAGASGGIQPAAAPPVVPAGASVADAAPTLPSGESRRKPRRIVRVEQPGDALRCARQWRPGTRRGTRPVPVAREQKRTEITTPAAHKRVVRIGETIAVADLARAMSVKVAAVIEKAAELGVRVAGSELLDADQAEVVASEFAYTVARVGRRPAAYAASVPAGQAGTDAVRRAPVVTVMGHVDHGKTSLLDAIRSSRVAAGEAGGITQHIGASVVQVRERPVVFIDTPGHEAFTAMRGRGAQVTDLVVLVVAADDGVMPQTVEAISHARAAGVPILVAVNKIDKVDADVGRVRTALADHGLVAEEWGGDTTLVPVSARTREGLDRLLEMLLLHADILDLRAPVATRASGTVIEAKLDRGHGPVATVLVQQGTLRRGDAFVCGLQHGRLRAMFDDRGRGAESAGPSTPVEIVGLAGVPAAGDAFVVVGDEATAREVAEHRRQERQRANLRAATFSLADLQARQEKAAAKELRTVLKTDVHGSIDALRTALARLSTDEVRLTTLHAAVGAITESDVLLASASEAVIVGFNVVPEPKAKKLAEREGIDVRFYRVIYEAIDDLRAAVEGLLEPLLRERSLGRAEVRQLFTISGVGKVAGVAVREGKVLLGARARLLRDHAAVAEGRIVSVRRFKEDVREVAAGSECGLRLEGCPDARPGDVIQVFETETVARRLPGG